MASYICFTTLTLLLSLIAPLVLGNPVPPYPRPALTCTDESSPPISRDCLSLVLLLRASARRPGGNLEKRWGKSQQERPAARTAHLPKKYYMEKVDPSGTTPNTCMFFLSDHPRPELPDYDEFRLLDVVELEDRLIGRCLINENRGGYGYPGKYKTVYSKLTRYIPTANGVSWNSKPTALITQVIGNETMTLYEETMPDQVLDPLETQILDPQILDVQTTR